MTDQVCNKSVAQTVGSEFVSDLCGGGIYNLNQVSPGSDIVYDTGDSFVYLNPCGQVFNPNCSNIAADSVANGATVCQAYKDRVGNDYELAAWSPLSAPIRYQILSNGVRQTHMDGAYCNGNPRVVSIDYTCDATAATPSITNFVVTGFSNACVYNITVKTSKVCGTAFQSTIPTCVGAGYDLSKSLAGVQLHYLQNDDGQSQPFVVNVCGNVSGHSDPWAAGCGGQVCSNGYNMSYYDPAAVQWYPADNGVIQISQNGQRCGNGDNRYTVLRFVCDPKSTTPKIVSAGEFPMCHYFIIINSNAVCKPPADYRAVGKQWVSDLCGGGAYNLAAISGSDMEYVQGTLHNFFRPCGSVTNASCGQVGTPLDESFCQSYEPLNFTNPRETYKIGSYDPVRAPVLYTLTSNGLLQYYASGDFADGYPRALNVSYVCNAAATVPRITARSDYKIQHPEAPAPNSAQTVYNVEVQTNVVCGAPFQKQACGYDAVDLSGLVGTTYSGTYNGATYYVAPCSTVHASATNGCTGQVCQNGYPQSNYDALNTRWTYADNGLVQQNQDGVFCGNSFARATTIRYVCNAAAITATLSNAVEDPVCHFTLYIQTAAACASNGVPAPVSRAVGSTWFSDLCGGNAWFLGAVSPTTDLSVLASDGSTIYINPCGNVSTPACAGVGAYNSLATVCQVTGTTPTMLASWNPVSSPIKYTLLSNGIMQTHEDGSQCGNMIRIVSISYLCDPSRTTAAITAFTSANCVYNITVMTSQTCTPAFVPVCKYGNYDLSTIAGVTVSKLVGSDYWSVSPCGNVSTSFTPTCTAEICQTSTAISYWNPVIATWSRSDNGVVHALQDGLLCGGNGLRQGALRFICNPLATTPFIIAAGENPTCHYTVEIATSAVCPVDTSFRTSPGSSSWISSVCGGGAYNLLALGFNDITYATDHNTYIFFQPCGVVQNASCSNLPFTSLCEANLPLNPTSPGNDVQVATYDPARSPVKYTIIPNGITQYSQTGAYTGGNPRATNVTYLCSPSDTTPRITSYTNGLAFIPGTVNAVTVYQLTVMTNAVCGAPFVNGTYPCKPIVNGRTYDLSSLVGQQMSLDSTGMGLYNYLVSVCGSVDSEYSNGCTGQVCQGGTLLSQYIPSQTTWVAADNGVVQITQDGVYCGDISNYRELTLRFVCDPTATTPKVISAGEKPECHYDIEVATSVVCGITPSHEVGSIYISDVCGGGVYNLNTIAIQDITSVVDASSGNPAILSINPCGSVRTTNCSSDSSICYYYLSSKQPYVLGRFDPVHAAISYQVLANGVMSIHTDGDYCGDNRNILRTVYTSYVCDSTYATPTITNYTSANCNYYIQVSTSATCGPPFAASSSSSSTSIPRSSSSSSSSIPVVASSSSSSGNISPSSSSSTSGGNGGGAGNDNSSNSSSSLGGGAIAGIVIGALAGVVILVCLLFLICRGGAVDKGTGFNNLGAGTGNEVEMSRGADVEMSQVSEEPSGEHTTD